LRLDLFTSGLIDDLFVEKVSLMIERTGDSRYRLHMMNTQSVEIELWTTRKDRIRVARWDETPGWIDLKLAQSSELLGLHATDCDVHLEHLDRPAYFLGLARGRERWGLTLAATGYIKTRLLSPLPFSQPRRRSSE
jgi:hypothetical protein